MEILTQLDYLDDEMRLLGRARTAGTAIAPRFGRFTVKSGRADRLLSGSPLETFEALQISCSRSRQRTAHRAEPGFAALELDQAGLLTCGRQRELHAAVLRPAFRGVIRSDWIGVAEALGRDQIRLHTLRDHVLHDCVSPLLR